MKTQISRNSFAAQKRYSGVYQQMGRMLTDADWNEFSDLAKNRLSEALTDIIGSGTPKKRGLIAEIINPDDTTSYALRWGHAYVNGIAAQVRPDLATTLNDATGLAFEYEHQADFPLAPAPVGDHILYLDVWERNVLALEDRELLDAGLHGADTCTRTQTMAQVKWCPTSVDPQDPAQNPTIGDALLSLTLRQGSSDPDPCDPCANEIALQDDVGNYLFRFEVHAVEYDASGAPTQVILKWSSENAGEQYAIGDMPLGFANNNWAYEFYQGAAQSFASEKHLGKHLVSGFVPESGELTNGYPDTVPVGYELVRRWDGFCKLTKSGANWNLITDSGVDRGIGMSATSSSDAHGHVAQGATVVLNFNHVTARLNLADWQILAGDYWQAMVRQAVHVAGSEVLTESKPQGVVHHYMTLGTVTAGTFVAHDSTVCKRFNFPALTDINAADVCYDNDTCNMANVKTVEDALDHLCKARDLRWHNKHLHGWGIVCGLIAECCPGHSDDDIEAGASDGSGSDDENSRRSIHVTPGYALTCDGDDIVLGTMREVNVLDQIATMEAAGETVLTNGDGTVCLRVDLGSNGEPDFSLEAYDKAKHSKNIFDGTLLMDFFQHCIMDVVDAVRNEFRFLTAAELAAVEGGNTGLVSVQRRKMTSILNLIIQLFNVNNGGYVFLSLKEHAILKDFYLQLRNLLRSKTFCAMYDGMEFPDYPFLESGMTTLFGKNLHTRLKVHPDGNRLYSYNGADNTINIYDRAQEALISVLAMPSAEGSQVTAIAFSPDGDLLYAAATVRGVDTVFGIARINDNHSWEEMTILCDIRLSEMEVSTQDAGLIYALGLGKGLYYLRPEIIFADTKPQPAPAYAFNAIGHMQLDVRGGNAYCTIHSDAATTGKYNRVVVCSLNTSGENLVPNTTLFIGTAAAGLEGNDGIALRTTANGAATHLYVVAGTGDKLLLTYALPLVSSTALPINIVGLEATSISLAFHRQRNQLILGFEDGYRLQLFEANGLSNNVFRVPVQIQPTDLVVNPTNNEVYSLNFISNTISVIPANELMVTEPFLQTLLQYRMAVLMAFYALAGNLLQYLKDCFCHHLLVKCPSCNDDKIIYVATIEIRNNEVFKICNFDKRKTVKTFPTVDYWMSIVPIMPLIQAAVSKVCCAVFPNIFAKYTANVIRTPDPQYAAAPMANTQQQYAINTVQAQSARSLVQTTQRIDARAILRNQSKSMKLVGNLGGDTALTFLQLNQTNQAGLRKQSLIDANTNDAMLELERNNIVVAQVEEYDPRKAGQYIADYTKTPQRIERGSEVTLVQKDGKVMYYAIKQKTSTIAVGEMTDTLRTELDSLQQEKALMESELVLLRNEFNRISNTRAQEEAQLMRLKTEREQLATDLNSLSTNLQTMDTMRRELTLEVNKTRPIRDLQEVDAETEVMLQEAGIRTIEELAKADTAALSNDRRLSINKLSIIQSDARSRLGLLP